MTTAAPPHDDLAATLATAFGLIGRGVVDRRSPFHTPTLATAGLDGAPALRTVVLRAFDPDGRRLRVHTDGRSPKVAEIAREPRVALHVYDAGARIQIRLDGLATLHRGDDEAAAAWRDSQPMSRECYRIEPGPGTPIADPRLAVIAPAPAAAAPAAADPGADPGFAHFTAVVVELTRLEWLDLAAAGHRRARFSWRDGAAEATWLAP